MLITSKMIGQIGLQKQNPNTTTNSIIPQGSYSSTSTMDAIPGKEMETGQLLYPRYKDSQKNLMELGGICYDMAYGPLL